MQLQQQHYCPVEKDHYNIFPCQPYNATRINASNIEDRVSELLKENGNVDGKGGFWEEFEVTWISAACVFIQFGVMFLD